MLQDYLLCQQERSYFYLLVQDVFASLRCRLFSRMYLMHCITVALRVVSTGFHQPTCTAHYCAIIWVFRITSGVRNIKSGAAVMRSASGLQTRKTYVACHRCRFPSILKVRLRQTLERVVCYPQHQNQHALCNNASMGLTATAKFAGASLSV